MTQKIPKIIHFFHNSDIDIYKKNYHSTFRICYYSWLMACPDYQIIHWHENMPEFKEILEKSPFAKKAYELKLWAFVSDYVRVYALNKFGGIYLDTDVQLLKNFDDFLDEKFFLSIEGDILNGKNIPEPAIIGGIKGHVLFSEIMKIYESKQIFGNYQIIANIIYGDVIENFCGFNRIKFETEQMDEIVEKFYNPQVYCQRINDINLYKNQKKYQNDELGISIYPSEYFCPSWDTFKTDAITDKTVSIHWNQSSWWDVKKIKQIIACKYNKNSFKKFLFMNNDQISKMLDFCMPVKKINKKIRGKINSILSQG